MFGNLFAKHMPAIVVPTATFPCRAQTILIKASAIFATGARITL